ncbi:MAG: hypothetical protein KF744_01320 [Taibaiella sp.]|nr:hypothetical protein [Taibaiella sp.]
MKEFLFRTRRGLLLQLLVLLLCIWGVRKYLLPHDDREYKVPAANLFIFPDVAGPQEVSVIHKGHVPSWREYDFDCPSAMAILLTDTQSQWIGLVHGLKSIGVPFVITRDVQAALKHKVVFVYPFVSGKVLSMDELKAIAAIPRNGGTLLATNVYGGGLNEVFDYDDIVPARSHKSLQLRQGTGFPMFDSIFSGAINSEILLSSNTGRDTMPGVGYTHARHPIIGFEDTTSCLVYKDYGVGHAFAIGFDLGNYFLRNMNGRGPDNTRAYVNVYDGGVDILLRMLKEIYSFRNGEAVTLCPTPGGKSFTILLTHDIDFTRSIVNAALYAGMEKANGVKATYFIQTKYVKDWNDDIFFKDSNITYLHQVQDAGMEVASHSVAHSKVFSKFPMGTGKEQYPSYTPFVKERLVTYNGSILGELRVSKFLLEHFAPGTIVRSFRPGHLQYPSALPQALVATGYVNSSSLTAGDAQTYLPYRLMYDRAGDQETDVLEVPVAVEDERGLPMLQRFDSCMLLARHLSSYGGVMNVLIHTDIIGQKFAFEEKLINACRDIASFSTLGDYCDWWRSRYDVHLSVVTHDKGYVVTLSTPPGSGEVKGLTIQVPASWSLQGSLPGVSQQGSKVVVQSFSGNLEIPFLQH